MKIEFTVYGKADLPTGGVMNKELQDALRERRRIDPGAPHVVMAAIDEKVNPIPIPFPELVEMILNHAKPKPGPHYCEIHRTTTPGFCVMCKAIDQPRKEIPLRDGPIALDLEKNDRARQESIPKVRAPPGTRWAEDNETETETEGK